MNNLVIRSIAGIIFSVVVICSALLGELALGILFLVFSSIGLYEFYTITSESSKNPEVKWIGLLLGIALYLVLFFVFTDVIEVKFLWIFPALLSVLFCALLLRIEQKQMEHLAFTLMGLIYVVFPFSLVNLLAHVDGQFNYEWPVGFFLILWANDTGAYITGKFLGKTKLYEKVSPNKTWEGLMGGIVFAFAVAWILSHYFISVPLNQWLVVSVIISIFGNLGDLFESMLKRRFNVKDSGSIMPGHGGALDRFDGLLMSMPVVICYLILFS
ncbi:MAG: phosphatidate cytidylyltransferase [Flavobacteriales bacterium]